MKGKLRRRFFSWLKVRFNRKIKKRSFPVANLLSLFSLVYQYSFTELSVAYYSFVLCKMLKKDMCRYLEFQTLHCGLHTLKKSNQTLVLI